MDMQKVVLTLFFTLFFNLSFAAKSLQAESKFLSKDEDSLSFVKKQLINNAFKLVIDKKLKEMNLDARTFWQNYNSKFEEHFKTIRDALRLKYQKDPEKDLEREQIEEYEKKLRVKRLKSKASFGRLSRVIQSYSIEKFSKSIAIPNSHFIRLSASVNEEKLAEIYYKFIGASALRAFNKVFIDAKINLKNITWVELGVNIESDFVNVLNDNWRKKIIDRSGDLFSAGAEIVDNVKRDEIKEHINTKSKVSSDLSSPDILNELSDSLYVKTHVNIKNIDFNPQTSEYLLQFTGGLLIYDLKDGSIAKHLDFAPREISFTKVDDHSFSSSIASTMFEMTLPVMDNFRKVVEENVTLKQQFIIAIENTKNLEEVYAIQKHLKEQGVVYFFKPDIKEVQQSRVILTVSFSGVKEKALKVLDVIARFKPSENREISRKNDLPFSFVIKDVKSSSDDKN